MKTRMQREDERINKEALGACASLCLDLAKLVFIGVVVAGAMDLTYDVRIKIMSGIVTAVFFMILWYILFNISKRKG